MKGFTFLVVAALAVAIASASALPASKAAKKRVVCYYGSWAVYRPGNGKFDVENIDPNICTHIVYGFVGLASDGTLTVLDSYNDLEENWGKGAMKRFTGLKSQNPELKAMVSIGGWNEGSEKYSNMAATQQSRQKFIASVVPFLQSQNFDGLDLDWEYPTQRGGKPEDRENFDLLIAELRAEFDKHGYLLAAAVSAGAPVIQQAYNVPNLAKYLDFINIMAYDFHGAFETYTHHHCPLFEHPLDKENNNTVNNVDYAVRFWNSQGAPLEKLNIGMGTYGRGFTLDDASKNGLYAPASNPIPAGPYTREPGILGYNEICDYLQKEQWNVVNDPSLAAPYAVKERNWVGYESEESIGAKAAYARELGVGGAMVWSVETDDFRGDCGEPFALVKTIYRAMNGEIVAPTQPTTTSTTSTTPDPNNPTPTTTTTTTTTSTTTAGPPPEGVCISQGFNRDPNDCMTFYRCDWNGNDWHIETFHCGTGTVFNPAINGCDFPYNVPECS